MCVCVSCVYLAVYVFMYFNSLVVVNTVLHYEFMCGQAKVFCFEHQIWHEKCVHTARIDLFNTQMYIDRERERERARDEIAHTAMVLQSTGMMEAKHVRIPIVSQ